MSRRKVGIAVLSDVHLGTYGCHAKELIHYLKSIEPEMLVLNGDIIDIWQFSKRFWPKEHMQVLKEVMKLLAKGIPVYYLTGNHDELLRKFSDFNLGNFYLQDQLLLEVDGKRMWFFHGDVFDASMQYAKWLAKLGAVGYDFLILLNSLVNCCLSKLGREKMSFSKRIKNRVKSAVQYISAFEQSAMEVAVKNGYEYVICGHIHQPEIREWAGPEGTVHYLNSGDWVENLTALEYQNGSWSLYQHQEQKKPKEKSLLPLAEKVMVSA